MLGPEPLVQIGSCAIEKKSALVKLRHGAGAKGA